LFGDGGGAAAAAAAAAGGGGIAMAGGAAAKTRETGGASPAVAKHIEEDDALDFRFDEDVSISRTGNTTQQQIDAIDAAEREFEESAKHLGTAPSVGDKAKTAAAPPPPSGDLDFRLDPHTAGSLDEAAAKLKKEEPVSPSLARPQAAIDLDKLDLSFSPENQAFEDPTPSTLDGQWHDAATKLDLAKAYQEMGDVEGAREILQEVLHEGDDTQKAEAQVLLAKLG
jgi:pilus assembly protein FimV